MKWDDKKETVPGMKAIKYELCSRNTERKVAFRYIRLYRNAVYKLVVNDLLENGMDSGHFFTRSSSSEKK
jgi:hypothetical protein